MAHRVIWSPRALADVEAIASHVATDSNFYANAVVRRIVALAKSLADFPLVGRKVPEFDDETIRELLAYSYRIIYLVEQSESQLLP
jgi:toxin ParE1/3/4